MSDLLMATHRRCGEGGGGEKGKSKTGSNISMHTDDIMTYPGCSAVGCHHGPNLYKRQRRSERPWLFRHPKTTTHEKQQHELSTEQIDARVTNK